MYAVLGRAGAPIVVLAQARTAPSRPRDGSRLIEAPIGPSMACRQGEGDGDAEESGRLADDERQAADRRTVGDPHGAPDRVQAEPDQGDVVCGSGPDDSRGLGEWSERADQTRDQGRNGQGAPTAYRLAAARRELGGSAPL